MNVPWWVWLIVIGVVLMIVVIWWEWLPNKTRARWHWKRKHQKQYPDFAAVYNYPGGFIYERGFRYALECRHPDCRKNGQPLQL